MHRAPMLADLSSAYLRNAAAMWAALAPSGTTATETWFDVDQPRIRRRIYFSPPAPGEVVRWLQRGPATKMLVAEHAFDAAPTVPGAAVYTMPMMVRPPGPTPPDEAPGVRVESVGDAARLEAAERLIVESFPTRAYLPYQPGQFLPAATLSVPGFRVWVAYRDGSPAAAGYTYDDGTVVGLYSLATAPEHRRRGAGRALLAAAFAAYPDQPFTLTATASGRSLYDALGFLPVATTTWHMRPARTV